MKKFNLKKSSCDCCELEEVENVQVSICKYLQKKGVHHNKKNSFEGSYEVCELCAENIKMFITNFDEWLINFVECTPDIEFIKNKEV